MTYRIIYSISDSHKRQSIERYLLSSGFKPLLPFSSMAITLREPLSELRRKLKKLRNAYLLPPEDRFVVLRIDETGKDEEEVGIV
jgi:hypothetical protein